MVVLEPAVHKTVAARTAIRQTGRPVVQVRAEVVATILAIGLAAAMRHQVVRQAIAEVLAKAGLPAVRTTGRVARHPVLREVIRQADPRHQVEARPGVVLLLLAPLEVLWGVVRHLPVHRGAQ